MSSTFNAQDAGNYERIMGRWSRRLAPLFIAFAGVAPGERILDVGCGTGSLSLALPEAVAVAEVVGVDVAEIYLDFARGRAADPRLRFERADATALPFPDRSFDRALSMLVLQFVPEAERAVLEMRRVVRPGGVVAAAVWDSYGGSPAHRMFWDTAAALDAGAAAARNHSFTRPLTRDGELARLWRELGLVAIEQRGLMIRFDYASFEDYWAPFLSGEGQLGRYIASLDPATRERIVVKLRDAYEGGAPDGPRSFVAVAWACRGTVPPG